LGSISRAQEGFVRFVGEAMFGERWARSPFLLQRLEVRAKLLSLLLILVTISLVHGLVSLALIALTGLGLALYCRIGIRGLGHPLWWAGPLVAALVALPAILHPFSPGEPAIVLLDRPFLAITSPGLEVAGRLVLRATASVWWAGALLLSSRWERVLAALHALHIPGAFVLALGMAHRYLFLLVRLGEKAFYARRSRSILPVSAATERALLGVGVASLFRRSLSLATQVHAAMLSRGFSGKYRTLADSPMVGVDLAWAGIVAFSCVGIWLADRFLLGI